MSDAAHKQNLFLSITIIVCDCTCCCYFPRIPLLRNTTSKCWSGSVKQQLKRLFPKKRRVTGIGRARRADNIPTTAFIFANTAREQIELENSMRKSFGNNCQIQREQGTKRTERRNRKIKLVSGF